MHARRGQSGAAALEFAFILPLLLFLIYGMVIYAYVFIVQEAITFAAQEAAEAAVKVDPAQSPEDYQDTVRQAVAAVLRCDDTDGQGGVLSFLRPRQQHGRDRPVADRHRRRRDGAAGVHVHRPVPATAAAGDRRHPAHAEYTGGPGRGRRLGPTRYER
jgi:hypothetical protein